MKKLILSSILLSSLLGAMSFSVFAADKLVVYSARNEQLIKHVFDAYRNETGTDISFITDKAAPLLVRLKAEGKRTPADVLITVDAGNLWKAEQDGVLQPLDSKILNKNIPASLRDPENNWFGMSVRARTIVYHPGRVKSSALSTYEALADPKFKGRLCLRTSKKVYNQSLVAMLIARHGEVKTEAIVKGWVANLATKVFSNDTSVMKAITAGQCDIGIVNTYYYGRLLKKDPGIELKLFWPNQKTHGVHVNISGAAVTRYSKHKVAAQKFLEWLSGPTAQRLFADSNMEYPANKNVPANRIVQSWGKFKQDDMNLVQAGKLQAKAVMLMDRAGYK
ncbi:MAG: extracellular solute-binding protein [Acidiferrobacterales bacterium]